MKITCNNLSFSYKNHPIYRNFNLEIKSHRTTVILGPSGCGKTTLLNLISQILKPDSGNISLDGEKEISYLFQEPRLLNWKNVYQNISFVLDSLSDDKRSEIIKHFLKELDLEKFSHYYPYQLSGGMKQRVSIARAFAYPSSLLLMDEPFKGLDPGIKNSIYRKYNTLWSEDRRTALLVTHDVKEALMLADDIIILSKSPITILKQLRNPIDYKKRVINSEEFIHFEAELYKYLM